MTHHLGLLHLPAWPFSCLFHPRDGQACLIPVKLRQQILQSFWLSMVEGINSAAVGGMEVVAGLQGHCEWTPCWRRDKEGWEVPCRGMNSSAGWGWDFTTSFLWAWLSCSMRSRDKQLPHRDQLWQWAGIKSVKSPGSFTARSLNNGSSEERSGANACFHDPTHGEVCPSSSKSRQALSGERFFFKYIYIYIWLHWIFVACVGLL